MTTETASQSPIDTVEIQKVIDIAAPIEIAFEAMLEEIGPGGEMPGGKPFPMVVEQWPGGRWYRDLGDNNGHFWAHVQAIKRPTLLEFTRPLFMSYPVISNLQYRLSEQEGETLIQFHHAALGFIPEDYRKEMVKGWSSMHERTRTRAEKK